MVQHRPERVQRRLAAGAHSHQLLGLQGGRGLGPQAPGVNKGSATAVGDEAERPGHHLADLGVQIQEGVVLGTNGTNRPQLSKLTENMSDCFLVQANVSLTGAVCFSTPLHNVFGKLISKEDWIYTCSVARSFLRRRAGRPSENPSDVLRATRTQNDAQTQKPHRRSNSRNFADADQYALHESHGAEKEP